MITIIKRFLNPRTNHNSKAMKTRLIYFFTNSNIHGLKYTVGKNAHWAQKLFWSLSCCIAAYFMLIWGRESWYKFKYNPIGFVQDTSYLEWNSSFPAISVCETDADLGAISILADRLYGPDHDLDIETYLKDIVYFEGKCYSCQNLCGKTLNCSQDIKDLLNKARLPCEKLMKNCFWNGKPINCCQVFRPLETEVGICYSFNSIHNKKSLKDIDFKSNKRTGPGVLNFQINKDIVVYIHAEEDVPFMNHPIQEKELIILGTKIHLSFQMTEINNDPNLYGVPIKIRKCKFPNEGGLKLYKKYSYSGCIVECRAKSQLNLCNCTHHFVPKGLNVKTCGLSGLTCLTHYTKYLGSLKTPDSTKQGLVCGCYSSCNEPDIIVVSKSGQGNSPEYSDVTIKMESLPSTRFKRFVAMTNLEFTVNLGGISGLNFGASLLSIVEIIYFLFIRKINKKKYRKAILKKIPPKHPIYLP